MGKVLLVFGSLNNAVLDNAESVPCGGGFGAGGADAGNDISFRQAGTFTLIGYNNRGGSSTHNVSLYVNDVLGNNAIQNTGTGYLEGVGLSDAIAANDVIKLHYTDNGTNPTYSLNKIVFEATGDHLSHYCSGGPIGAGGIFDAASSTRFIKLGGFLDSDGIAVEATEQLKSRITGTIKSLQANVISNARTNTSTITVRINGFDKTCTLSIGAGVTGRIVDDVNSDAIVPGDLFCAGITLDTGVEDLQIASVDAVITNTAADESDIFIETSGVRGASATAHYFPIGGAWPCNNNTTETDVSLTPGFSGTLRNLRCYASTNSYSADATIKVFKNGSAALTLTVSAGVTGWQENTVDTLSFAATDTLSYQIVGGTSGSLTLLSVGITMSDVGEAVVASFAMGYGDGSRPMATVGY